MHCGATEHPTDEWVAQQLREAIPFEEQPKYLIFDHDRKFGAGFERVAEGPGLEFRRTPYQTPVANAICERFAGSVRRERLDHILVQGVRQLQRILKEYVS